MPELWENPNTDDLLEAILMLKTRQEAKRFFRDLLTEDEIIEFGRRWKVARMLERKTPYSAIEQKTGLSSKTIARISRWLERGMGGYKLMLARLHHGTDSRLARKAS
jgi:TrpR-related protein YerC/YecD